MNLLVEPLELVLDLLRQLHEIDVGPAARRARHEREAPAPQTERFQNVDPDAHLFGRIGRERDADGVADPLRQQRAQPDRGLDRSDSWRARFGHAQVERVVDLVGQHPVRLDHHQRIGGLQRDLHLRVVQVLEDPDVAERRLDHALRGGPVVLGQEVLLQGAPVDADADRDALVLGDVDDFLHEALAADVPRVQPEAVHALLERDQGELVVEVDVGHQRDPDLPLDLAEFLGGLPNRDRAPDHVTARRLQRPDLEQRCLDVARVGLRHRLHGDRSLAAHLEVPELDLPRRSPCDHSLSYLKNLNASIRTRSL